jgi:type IV pilus assembly protein PilW
MSVVMKSGGAMQRGAGRADGFSLIELMIAMTVTLVVSGAIYGLLAGGQSAFRREPELSERQQNIRVAMDTILRDIANAGSGLPNFVQTFTPGLDACATCPMGSGGATTDELEILTNSGARNNEQACFVLPPAAPGAPPGWANAVDQLPMVWSSTNIPDNTVVILTMTDGTWTLRNVVTSTANANVIAGSAPENCSPDAPVHRLLDMGTGGDTTGLNVAGTLCTPSGLGNPSFPLTVGMGTTNTPCDVMEVSFGEVVRYRVRLDGTIPVLQRLTTANIGAGYQTLARGIDDLQVQYIAADQDATDPTKWVDDAPVVAANTYNSIITQVRVTLSARSEAQNIQGATISADGTARMRGMLTATAAPRSSLLALASQPIPSPAPSPMPSWWWR